MRVVAVTWTDAAQYGDEWVDVGYGGFTVDTAGWLVDETPDALYVARDYDPDTETWRGLLAIPKRMIESRQDYG